MKKYLSMLLALAMLLTLLGGCGQSQSTPASSAEAETAQSEAVPAPEAEEAPETPETSQAESTVEEIPEETYERVDYDLPLFEEPFEITAFYPTKQGGGGGSMPPRDNNEFPFWQRLQETLNVDFSFREPMDSVAADQFNLMVASGDMTDIVFESIISTTASAYTGGYDKAIEDEVYVNIAEYMDYAPNYTYFIYGNPDNEKVVVTDGGNIGAFMKIFSEPEKTNIGLTVHKEYLDETGLEAPTTVKEWMEVFEAMAANGVKYPCDVNSSGQIQNGYFTDAIGACISTAFLIDNATGELVFGPTTAETKEYLELFLQCVENEWVDPDWFNNTYMENPLFVDGSVATCQQIGQRLESLAAQYGFGMEPCPLLHREGYEAGQLAIGEVAYPLASTGGGVAITTACEEIETVVGVMDWFYSPEGAELCNYGFVEDETYYIDGDQKFITPFFSATNENYNFGNKSLYTSDRDFGYVYPNLSYYVAAELQKRANDLWTPDYSNEAAIYLNLPGSVRLTSEESEQLTTLISDLDTYVQSTIFGWMNKSNEFSDAAWDEFVETCQSMHLDEIQAGYEAAYQRYLSK